MGRAPQCAAQGFHLTGEHEVRGALGGALKKQMLYQMRQTLLAILFATRTGVCPYVDADCMKVREGINEKGQSIGQALLVNGGRHAANYGMGAGEFQVGGPPELGRRQKYLFKGGDYTIQRMARGSSAVNQASTRATW